MSAHDVWGSIMREGNDGIVPARNQLPVTLMNAYNEGAFSGDLDALAVALEDAWTGCEFPMLALDRWEWCELFDAVGFLENTTRTTRPPEIPTLFRAAARGYEAGISWTDDLARAEWFYDRNIRFGLPTSLLTVTNPNPSVTMAHFHSSRGENEWALNTVLLDGQVTELRRSVP